MFEKKQTTALEQLDKKGVKLYPNPAKDFVVVEGLSPKAEVKVFDLNGKLVLRSQANDEGRGKLDVSTLANGFYLLRTADKVARLEVRH